MARNYSFNQQTTSRAKKPKKPKEQPQRANIPFAQKSKMFEVPTPVRINVKSKEGVEYLIYGTTAKINKLATVRDFRSRNFSERLASSKNFADTAFNYYEDPLKKAKLSNERVKIELTKEYLQDPEYYTSAIIASLTERVAEADAEFVNSIHTINEILDNLEEVEKFKKGTLAEKVSQRFKDEATARCFSNHSQDFNFDTIDTSTKEGVLKTSKKEYNINYEINY